VDEGVLQDLLDIVGNICEHFLREILSHAGHT
jgi:hypothetical protein